jgi:hypothetical protein
MKKFHEVQELKADEVYLYLTVDGQPYHIRWTDCSPTLAQATHRHRLITKVSPSGYGLHWPLIDKDLAITPLLQRAEPAVDTEPGPDDVWVIPEPAQPTSTSAS